MERKEIEEILYKEMERRYKVLDSLTKRIQDNISEDKPLIVDEDDRNALCAILDTFNGNNLFED